MPSGRAGERLKSSVVGDCAFLCHAWTSDEVAEHRDSDQEQACRAQIHPVHRCREELCFLILKATATRNPILPSFLIAGRLHFW